MGALRDTAPIALLALVLAAATPLRAADLVDDPYYDSQATTAVYDWTGFYAGGTLGYGWGSAGAADPDGVVGGLLGGYSMQSGPIVFGLETDLMLSGMEGDVSGSTRSIDWLGSLRGRVGYGVGTLLFYGTGGFGFGGITVDRNGASDTVWSAGWVLGIGAEAAIGADWTARLEAFHYDLGSNTFRVGTSETFDTSADLIRLVTTYRF